MTGRRVWGLVGASVMALSVVVRSAQTPDEGLSELESLRVALHLAKVDQAQLRALIADREARLASCDLSAERATLDAEIHLTHPTRRVDWATGRLVESAAPK